MSFFIIIIFVFILFWCGRRSVKLDKRDRIYNEKT